MNFTEIEPVEFELNDTITWGVEKNIRKGYSIPVSVNDEVKSKIEELAKEYNAKSPLYGGGERKTLYLRSRILTGKQKDDLLDKDLTYVSVRFEANRLVVDKNGENHICFTVTELKKLNKELPKYLRAPKD